MCFAPSCHAVAFDLVQKLLTVDPEKRLRIEAALEHPWLQVRAHLRGLVAGLPPALASQRGRLCPPPKWGPASRLPPGKGCWHGVGGRDLVAEAEGKVVHSQPTAVARCPPPHPLPRVKSTPFPPGREHEVHLPAAAHTDRSGSSCPSSPNCGNLSRFSQQRWGGEAAAPVLPLPLG